MVNLGQDTKKSSPFLSHTVLLLHRKQTDDLKDFKHSSLSTIISNLL